MEGLLAWAKRVLIQATLGISLCGISLYLQEKLYLIMPIVAGSIVGAACWIVISYRILKSAELNIDEAKKSMQFGWVIRLLLIMGTLVVAIQVSEEIFWAVVIGLFLMSGIIMMNAIVYAYNSNASKKK